MNFAFLWPVFIILHYAGVEYFRWPHGISIPMVVGTTILVFTNNYLFTFGAAVTSPIFVSLGGMLSIPTIVVVDWILHNITPSLFKIFGAAIVFIGFILVNVDFDCFGNKENETSPLLSDQDLVSSSPHFLEVGVRAGTIMESQMMINQ